MDDLSPIQFPNTNSPAPEQPPAPETEKPKTGDVRPEPPAEQSREKLSRIRTFRRDTESFVREKGVTLASLVAQKKAKIVEAPRIRSSAQRIIAWLIAVILVAGLAVGGFFLLKNGGMIIETPRTEKPISVFPLFDDRTITVRNSPADFIPEWQNLLLRSIPQGQVLGVFVFSEVKNRFLSPGEWFDFLGIQLTPTLRVTVSAPWTLGVIGTSGGSAPVFIIPVTSFEQALAGMLAWEQDQPLALRNILPANIPQRQFERFEDTIIKNQDVRFLENEQGGMILVYAFFNRKILIITTSIEAMEQVIERFLITPPTI